MATPPTSASSSAAAATAPWVHRSLAAAVESNDHAAVLHKLAMGHSPSLPAEHGEPPLVVAVRNCTPQAKAVWNALLAAGATPDDTAPTTGVTPLMEAALRGNESAVRALLRAGADPARRDLSGRTALHYAAIGGAAGLLRNLDELTHGAMRNAADASRYTPLMYAAEHGSLPCVVYLLSVGADTTVRSKAMSHVAYELAAWFGHTSVAMYLASHKADMGGAAAAAAAAALAAGTPAIERVQSAAVPPASAFAGPGGVGAPPAGGGAVAGSSTGVAAAMMEGLSIHAPRV